MTDRHTELLRSEAAAEQIESELTALAEKLQTRFQEAADKLEALGSGARRALEGLGVGRDPELEALVQRLTGTKLPASELPAQRAQSLDARAAALKARQESNTRMRQTADAWAAELAKQTAQLSRDAGLLEAIERRTREAAQRRAAEAARPPPVAQQPPAIAPTAPTESRREKARVQLQAQIDLYSDANFFAGFSTDIGTGGVFIATTQQVPIGTEVDLSFSLPTGEQIAARGRVRWTREVNDATPHIFPGMGVQFTELAAAALEAIRRFVEGREPLFFPD